MARLKKYRGPLAILLVCTVSAGTLICAQAQPKTPVQVKSETSKPSDIQVLEAKVIKLQMENFELQKQFAACQQQILAGVARNHEESILKSVGAKPTQKFDWNTMTVTPTPSPSTQKP